jgi:hypothetical protein
MLGVNSLDNGQMTRPTGVFRDRLTARLHANGLMKIAGREGIRVPEAVIGLRIILGDDVRWRMTIITGGHGPMTRFDPGIVVVLHDVTVGTRSRVIYQIRPALGI